MATQDGDACRIQRHQSRCLVTETHTSTESIERTQKVQETLEQILETLRKSTIADKGEKDARSGFWMAYQKVADEYDGEMLVKYNEDMDILLVFTGLFSAVNTAFIIAMQPNPADTTNVLLAQLITTINPTPSTAQAAESFLFKDNSSADVWIQSLAYASLSFSLLAAFGAVVSKQWLGHYSTGRYIRGSLEDRCRHRHRKLEGLEAWRFSVVLQVFPVLLQLSLLFFCISLAASIWTQQRIVGAILVGSMATGLMFFIVTAIAALTHPDCPYQSPISRIARNLFAAVKRSHQRSALAPKWVYWLRFNMVPPSCIIHSSFPTLLPSLHFMSTFVRRGRIIIVRIGGIFDPLWTSIPHEASRQRAADEESVSGFGNYQQSVITLPPAPAGSSLEALSLRWLIETSTEPSTFIAAARLVPEIEWPSGLDVSIAISRFSSAFIACFNLQHKLLPQARDRAFTYGHALTHFYSEGYPHTEVNMISLWNEVKSHMYWFAREDREFMTIYKVAVCELDGGFTHFGWDLPQPSDHLVQWLSHVIPLVRSCRESLELEKFGLVVISRILETQSFPTMQVLANCAVLLCQISGMTIERVAVKKMNKSHAIHELLRRLAEQFLAALCAPGGRRDQLLSVETLRLLPLAWHISSLASPNESHASIFVQSGLEYCKRFFQQSLGCQGQALREHLQEDARVMLHTAISASEIRWPPDDERAVGLCSVTWPNDQRTPAEFDWLIEYANHLRVSEPTCFDARADAILALTAMEGLGSSHYRGLYLDILISSMHPDNPWRLRHAALRAVGDFITPLDNIDDEFIQAQLISELSPSLLRSFCPKTDPGSRNPHSPPSSHHTYVRILYSISRNITWSRRLSQDAHVQKCIEILEGFVALSEWQYNGHWGVIQLAAIFARFDTSGNLQPTPLDTLSQKSWRDFFHQVWRSMNRTDVIASMSEDFPAISEYTMKRLPTDTLPSDIVHLNEWTHRLLIILEEKGESGEVITAVQRFQWWLQERLNPSK